MKILITGGAGFIGTNISLEARKRGYDVVAFDSLIRKGTEENIPVIQRAGVILFRGDIRLKEDIERLSEEHSVDAIIHLAGNPGIPWSISYPAYDFGVNGIGTMNILELARRLNIPIIYASTNKTYSDLINEVSLQELKTRYEWNQPKEGWIEGISYEGISEGFPTDGYGKYAHSPYGISKLTGDMYCQEYCHTYGLPVVVNRMSCIYGYYQKGVADQGWIDHFVRQFLTDKPTIDIYGDGKQVRDMLWGEDVANLYLNELEHINDKDGNEKFTIRGEIFNIGGGRNNTLSLLESVSYLEKLSGKKASLRFHDWRQADQKIYISDIKKITTKLNWKPTTNPFDGIKKMYERYKGL